MVWTSDYVDTNVLVHSNNPTNCYFTSSNDSINKILKDDLYICVDDIFSIDDTNTSVIDHEYIQHVRHGTVAYQFLLDRLIKNRVKQFFKKDYKGLKRELNRKIENRHDIVFVLIAFGSQSKLLLSNDYQDFTACFRNYVKVAFGIVLIDSFVYLNESKEDDEDDMEPKEMATIT